MSGVLLNIFLTTKLEQSKNKKYLIPIWSFQARSDRTKNMISVILQCQNQEVKLARSLSALVAGAVEGLVSDVTVLDSGSDDDTMKVADAAGCHYYKAIDIEIMSKSLRSEWVFLIEPGAKPLSGWIEGLGEHVSIANKSARLSPSKSYRLPFVKRVLTQKTSLEYGCIMPKRDFVARAKTGSSLADIAKGVKTIQLKCEIVPASYVNA